METLRLVLVIPLFLILLPPNLFVSASSSEENSLLRMKEQNPATLRVSLPEGVKVGTNPDPWLNEGWMLNQTGNSWTFTLRIQQKSCWLRSFDTYLIIALNDAAYHHLADLSVEGIRMPKPAFRHGRPNPYGIWKWPNNVYPTWFNDTLINLGTIRPRCGCKEVVVSANFSDATGARMHFDAYGKTIPFWDPSCSRFITHNPNSKDSTVLSTPGPTPPVAHFSWQPPYPCPGQTVTFNASESTPNGGSIVSYQWDFGDGGSDTGEVVTKSYPSDGEYQVTLNVTDSEGLWDMETKTVTVVPAPTVSVKPPDINWTYQEHSTGENFTVDVYVNNVTNLWAWQAGMTFNATVLQCASFEEGPFLQQGGTTTWTPGTIDNDAGMITPHNCTLTSGSNPVSGSGVLGTITFTAISYGNSSLNLTGVGLFNPDMESIPIDVYDGSFQFIPPPPYGPKAHFIYSPLQPYANLNLTTFDASNSEPGWTGWREAPIINYTWDFDDGTPKVIESDPIATHNFTRIGSYNVTLTVTDSQGRKNTYSRQVLVDAIKPEACITWTPKYPHLEETVTFNASYSTPDGGTLTSYEWDFGDGKTGTGMICDHIYAAGGTYNVTLTVHDSEGKSDPAWALVSVLTEVYETPPTSVASELGQDFILSIETDNITDLYRFEFKLGYNTTLLDVTSISEGMFLKSSGNTTFNYTIHESEGYIQVNATLQPPAPPANGSGVLANVEFNVTYATEWPETVGCTLDLYDTQLLDSDGTPISHTAADGLYTFMPQRHPPKALFSFSPPYPIRGETVTLNASASKPNGGSIANYTWNFGDTTTVTVTAPIITHNYPAAGTYNVTLLVIDTEQLNGTTWQTLKVLEYPESPTANFTYTPSNPVEDETVTFDASASLPGFDGENTCEITEYYWDFGDGNQTTEYNAVTTHVYQQVGVYTVNLTVYAPPGPHDPGYYPYDTFLKEVNVTTQPPPPEPPTADFTWSPALPKVGETVTFDASTSNDPDGTIVNYEWHFGDGKHAAGKIVTHTYSTAGDISVTLNVTDDDGLWDTESKTITVVAPRGPEASFTPSSITIDQGEAVTFDASASKPGWNGTHEMPITEYRWDFDGDGTIDQTTSDKTVTHTYNVPGIYYPKLTVYAPGATPETDSATGKVTVRTPTPPPVGGRSEALSLYKPPPPPLAIYILLIASLTVSTTLIKRKRN